MTEVFSHFALRSRHLSLLHEIQDSHVLLKQA
jgi:hypothetical protein